MEGVILHATTEALYLQLNSKLEKSLIPAKILLDKFRVIDESSRKTAPYTDPVYAPFYYYLGTLIEAESVAEIGIRLALLSGCFLKGCKTVKTFLGFQETTEEYYSLRLAKANIKSVFKGKFDFYLGKVTDDAFVDCFTKRNWDVVIINEEMTYDLHRNYLDMIWEHMTYEGLIVMDYISSHEPAKRAFFDFCKIQNRKPITFKTRYGVGIVQR